MEITSTLLVKKRPYGCSDELFLGLYWPRANLLRTEVTKNLNNYSWDINKLPSRKQLFKLGNYCFHLTYFRLRSIIIPQVINRRKTLPEHWSWERICPPSKWWFVIFKLGLIQRIKLDPYYQKKNLAESTHFKPVEITIHHLRITGGCGVCRGCGRYKIIVF